MSVLKDIQYGDSSNFNARIYLHAVYGTNRNSWPEWVFDGIEKTGNARVLEIGCGNALLWKANAAKIPEDWTITLSDFSAGMLEDARRNTEGICSRFTYEVIDVENIPYADGSFDIIIANHMMYHIPDRARALSEIKRVLAGDGTFYATTMERAYMKEIRSTLREYRTGSTGSGSSGGIMENFSLENGKEQLDPHFGRVDLLTYVNKLEVTGAGHFTDYVYSCNGIANGRVLLEEHERDNFTGFIQRMIQREGNINISANAGMFICRKE